MLYLKSQAEQPKLLVTVPFSESAKAVTVFLLQVTGRVTKQI